jgi:hypothetical protein
VSEVPSIGARIPANSAPQSELLPIVGVLDGERTAGGTLAVRQLLLGLAGHVVARQLLRVARLAEVSVAPAEPLGNRAAELALELNEVGAVLLAVLDAGAHADRRALAAHQLLRLVDALLRAVAAVLHAPEVGRLALEALVVGELVDGVGAQVVVETVIGVLQPLMLIYVLELSSFEGLLEHLVLHLHRRVHLLLQDGAVRRVNPLLARGALQEREHHARPWETLVHLLLDAIQVKEVLAGELDAGHLAQALGVANYAVGVGVVAQGLVLVLFHTVLM